MPESQIVLDASTMAAPVEVPGGLEGLPTFEEIPTDEVMGKKPDGSPLFKTKKVPIAYYWKEIAKVPQHDKAWAHRGQIEMNGEPRKIVFTRQGFDQTVDNFNERKKAGILPYLPDEHALRRDASYNNGEVIALERRGDSLHAKLKVVGSNSIEKLLKNDVSVYLVNGDDQLVYDGKGKRYDGLVLQHLSLTPNPMIPHLGPFVRIAASAESDERVIPVFNFIDTSTAARSRRSYLMKPETAQQVRAKLGFGADVPDDQLDDRAAEKAIALSAEIDTEKNKVAQLTIERDKAKAEADTAKEDKTLAIAASADVAQIDAGSLRLTKAAFKQARDRLITSGKMSVAAMDELDKEFFVNGNPTNYAIQCSAEGDDPPRYMRVLNVIEKNVDNGIRHNNQVPRNATPAQKNVAASADGTPENTYDDDYNAAKASRDRQLEARTANQA